MNFDVENKEKCITTFKKQWEEFRQALGNNEVGYRELEKIKRFNFFKCLNEVLNYENNKKDLTVSFKELYFNYSFCRGTKIKKSELVKNINFDRFIPNQKDFPRINRFSPVGEEYLYLACKVRFGEEKNYKAIEEVALKEIRAKSGEKIGICKFKIPYKGDLLCKKVIDLSIVDNITFEDIEREFSKWFLDFSNINNINNLKEDARKLILKMYLVILSSEIFKPVKNVKEEFEYAPFHCIAYYFKQLGFDGIIYKSTVCNNQYGKNIVLFNKLYAEPFEIKFIDL